MKRTILKTLTVSGLSAAFAFSPVMADEYDDYRKCLLKVVEENLEGKIEFQAALADLIINEDPGLGALAALNRDLQISLARVRGVRLSYLITTDLPRLVSASGLTRFLNFEWDSADEAILQNENKDYAVLVEQINLMTENNNDHPAWPELRARFVEIQTRGDFVKILEKMNQAQEKAGRRLESC